MDPLRIGGGRFRLPDTLTTNVVDRSEGRNMASELVEETQEQNGATRRRIARGWPVFTVLAVALLAFLIGGFGMSYQTKLTEVQKNDNAAWLPKTAESTQAGEEFEKFIPVQTFPGFVVFHSD